MKKVRIIKPMIWIIVITTIVYAIVVTISSVLLYQRVWAPEAKYESLLYTSDDTLGFKSIPNSSGRLILCAGDTVPIKFDDFGFRIPSTGKSITFTPDSVDVLYLGCSFTFGYGCRAEDTYPHLVSKTNGVSYINAAVSAHGLSQMYLLAERLIPQYRPRFVVLQRSSWLPYRGIDPFNRVDQGLLTVPYFSNPSENPRLLFPIEKSLVFELVEARESGKLS